MANLDIDLFKAARHATDRRAFGRHLRDVRPPTVETEGVARVRGAFDLRTALQDSRVRQLSLRALAGAVGDVVETTNWTTWPRIDLTWSGVTVSGSWLGYCTWHGARSLEVHAKGDGVVFAPVTCSTGYRNNAGVTAVHQLVLDCDGTGEWEPLLADLAKMGLAFLAHQSGGWTPTTPKWRIILPLTEPFGISGRPEVVRWRGIYSTVRTAVGSVAWLRGNGFDPATDAPCHAWYPGYRRGWDVPLRKGTHSDGKALDIERLVAALPPEDPPDHLADERPDLDSPSLLVLAFHMAGLLGAGMGDGRFAVYCPWNSFHSEPLAPDAEPTSATVLFPASTAANLGGFWCSHSSCGSRTAEEVLEALPEDVVEQARLEHLKHPRVARSPGRILGRIPARRLGRLRGNW